MFFDIWESKMPFESDEQNLKEYFNYRDTIPVDMRNSILNDGFFGDGTELHIHNTQANQGIGDGTELHIHNTQANQGRELSVDKNAIDEAFLILELDEYSEVYRQSNNVIKYILHTSTEFSEREARVKELDIIINNNQYIINEFISACKRACEFKEEDKLEVLLVLYDKSEYMIEVRKL